MHRGIQQYLFYFFISSGDNRCLLSGAPKAAERDFAGGKSLFLCLGRAGVSVFDAVQHCV